MSEQDPFEGQPVHTEEELRAFFDDLKDAHWDERRAHEGILISFAARCFGGVAHGRDLSGAFDLVSPDDPKPRIWIYRAHCGEPEDAMNELLTLAHELGHWQSWTSDPARYVRQTHLADLPPSQVSREDANLVLEEEERAWSFARPLLSEHTGFRDWPVFEVRRERALDIYRELYGAGERVDAQECP